MIESNNNLTLGEQLKKARKAKGFNIEEISSQTRIPAKYFLLIEKSEWEHLPPSVYVRGFILKYAKILDVDSGEVLKLYEEELEKLSKVFDKKNIIPVLKSSRIIITPKLIAILASLIIFAGILGYFGWQVYFLIRPPRLILDNPLSDLVTDGESQLFKGNAFGANILMINDKTVELDSQGHFSEILNLSKGLNVIELKAKNSLGKETTLVRKIILNR
ncbi:MAG: hypothetical protein US06_C0010G0004 [Parcubacteria group bacterium GW2011_GWC2_36_17]|nr:MAG: hypothetical protein US06_C0010G0004 [Parcubacteria group bacterium GW2011_GWC2_36_17]